MIKATACLATVNSRKRYTILSLFRRLALKPSKMKIQTFVFLDLETTGLPSQEGNTTKITEMCMTVVQANHINLQSFPRVLSKLVLCFNPLKSIGPKCKEITGLTNDLLEFQPKFQRETVTVIKSFLALQRKPICLVAHNGNSFDYPILRSEIHNAEDTLPDDILCIDSLQAFRHLDSREVDLKPEQTEQLDIHELPTQRNQVPPEFCDGFDELLFSIAEEVEVSNQAQKVNETTPTKRAKSNITDYFVSTSSNINDAYYMSPATKTDNLDRGKGNHETSLNRSGDSNTLPTRPLVQHALSSTGMKQSVDIRNRQSFKLIDVYSRLTKKEPAEAHQAEYDCSMLIECAVKIGEQFTDWANTNARKFSDVHIMKPGRKFQF